MQFHSNQLLDNGWHSDDWKLAEKLVQAGLSRSKCGLGYLGVLKKKSSLQYFRVGFWGSFLFFWSNPLVLNKTRNTAETFVPRTAAVINGFSKTGGGGKNQLEKKTKPKQPKKTPVVCRPRKLKISSFAHTYTQAYNKGHNSQNTHILCFTPFVILYSVVKACCLQEDEGPFHFLLFHLQFSVLLDLRWHNLK